MKLSRALVPLLALLASPLAAQQVLRVQAGAPGGNGLSWGSAFGDLQAALTAAAAQPSVQELWIAAGTYRPAAVDRSATFAVPDGVALYGGFAGTETLRDERDPSANLTLLDGDLAGDDQPGFLNYGDNSWHVVSAINVQSLVLDGLTVRGGSQGGGAGIRAFAARVELTNVVLRENWGLGSNNDGAGMLLAAGDVSVRDCRIVDNQTTTGGGALLTDPLTPLPKTAFFQNCVFERNLATDGAGISARGIVPWFLTLEGCTFLDGFATSGAGVSIHSEGRSTLDVFDCVFERNAGCAGGGIYASDTDARVQGCRFRSNGQRGGCGSGSGGGGLLSWSSSIQILSSTFHDERRGALFLDSGSTATAASSTFVSTSDVAANAAIRVQNGDLALEHCIVWGLGDQELRFGVAGSASASYCDVRFGGVVYPGEGNLETDPLLVDAANGDLHLSPGSPCIDAGRPGIVTTGADFEQDSRIVDGDLDGTPRIDIGADEYGPARLEIQGAPTPGSTLTIVTSGPSLSSILLFGPPGQHFFPQAGSLFVDLSRARAFTWPSPPSSVPVVVPAGVSGLFRTQELLFGGGVVVVSNYVEQQF